MKALQLIITIFVITLAACTIKPKGAPENAGTTATDSSSEAVDTSKGYLPVTAFVQEDMRRVDTFYAAILKKNTKDGKKDSVYIQHSDFHSIAKVFLDKAFDSANFQQQFTE